MGITMTEKKFKALSNELAKDLKTAEDLNVLTAQLIKITVEAALNAELDHHLGYTEYEYKGCHSGNNRNGYSTKTPKGNHGSIEIETPRDHNASFDPQIVSKGQTRITGMDDQVLTLYAKGRVPVILAMLFKICTVWTSSQVSSLKLLTTSWSVCLNGRADHWMRFIPSSI